MMIEILKIVPKNLVSYWFGKIMNFPLPQPLAKWSIVLFAKVFKIPLSEAEKTVDQYPSIGAFFIRHLKVGLRPLASSTYVHPADSELTIRGRISGDQILQAKGISYSLSDFLQITNVDIWQKGYFLTYYLCPRDYHRVHSPVAGRIKEVRYVPGELWPVNSQSVLKVPSLFCRNERVVVDIETEKGLMSVVFVGATNVGSIYLSFEPTFRTNHTHQREARKITYLEPITINKGDELGLFAMGSTVIIVAQEAWQNELQPLIQNTATSIFVKVKS